MCLLFICVYTYKYTHTHTHTHTLEYYSSIKKNEIVPFAASWMDLEIIIISKISQKEKDNYHMISLVCRNAAQMNLSMKQKQTHRHTEETSGGQVCMHRDRLRVCK